mmetsp:Transcript_49313/g.125245  ORF Transcript_49313/g.125245 Transcript_49313/m.125245 type:complete len:234 (+) Transcript_49313:341-1042(+)
MHGFLDLRQVLLQAVRMLDGRGALVDADHIADRAAQHDVAEVAFVAPGQRQPIIVVHEHVERHESTQVAPRGRAGAILALPQIVVRRDAHHADTAHELHDTDEVVLEDAAYRDVVALAARRRILDVQAHVVRLLARVLDDTHAGHAHPESGREPLREQLLGQATLHATDAAWPPDQTHTARATMHPDQSGDPAPARLLKWSAWATTPLLQHRLRVRPDGAARRPCGDGALRGH